MFSKNVFNVLKYVFKDFGLGKTFQLLKLSFTCSVKEYTIIFPGTMVTLLIMIESDFSYREYGEMQTKCWDQQF